MQQVYHDTGDAVVDFGHNPRPQIMIVKKKTADSPEIIEKSKIVLQVCHDTGLGPDSGQVGAFSMFSFQGGGPPSQARRQSLGMHEGGIEPHKARPA